MLSQIWPFRTPNVDSFPPTTIMSSFYSRTILTVVGLFSFTIGSPVARDVTTANAEAALDTLQQWYNQSTGLWIPSTGWWNS